MALSGTIPLTVSSTNSITGWISWTEENINAAANTSDIRANVYYSLPSTQGQSTGNENHSTFYLEINGTHYEMTTGMVLRPGDTKAVFSSDKVLTIEHDANGSKSIVISAGGGLPNTSGLASSSGSASVTLSLIPRASDFGTITGSAIGTAISIGISPKISGTFYHKVTWTFGSKSGSINGGKSATSVTWAATTAGGNTVANLAGEIPTSASGTAVLTLYTYSDSNRTKQVGTPATKNWTISLPATVKPTISSITAAETVALVNTTLGVSATRNDNYVQLVSKPKFTVSASGGTGTTTSLTYQITFGGTTKTATSTTGSSNQTFGAIVGSGSQAATITVTDSRGRSTQTTHAIAVLAYEQPTLSRVSALRSSTTPTTVNYKVTTKGGSLTIGAEEKNSLTVTITGGPSTKTESFTTFTELTTPIPHTGYDVSQSYVVSVVLSDAFFTVTQTNIRVPTASVIMDIRVDGKVAVGKYLENGAFDVNGAIFAKGAIASAGKLSPYDGNPGSYLNSSGGLYVTSSSNANGGIYFTGVGTGSSISTYTAAMYESLTTEGLITIKAPAGLRSQFLSQWPASATTYHIPFNSATSDADGQFTQYINGGLRYRTRAGTSSTDGLAMIYVGNNTASGSDGNAYGALQLYSTGSNYIQLRPADSVTANRTIYLPNKGGTIALTSDIPTSVGAFDSLWTGAITSGSATLSASAANYDYLIVYGSNGQNGTSYVTTICVNGDSANLVWIQDAYISFSVSGTSITISTASSGRYLRRVYGVKIG